MNYASKLMLAALLSGLLTSCASRTMDSIPTLAELNAYEKVIRARYQVMYDELEQKRAFLPQSPLTPFDTKLMRVPIAVEASSKNRASRANSAQRQGV